MTQAPARANVAPLRHVLAATDLSAHARHAADRAAGVAAANGAALRLHHVLSASALEELRRWLGADNSAQQAVVDEAQRSLDALASSLGSAHDLVVQTALSTGVALDQLLGSAEQWQADLLVLGARGASTLRRLALGTTAERLLRRSRRPLLVVRQQAHSAYRRVLVPVDFSPWSGVSLALARRVAPQAHLVLLHIYEAPFADKLRFANVDQGAIDAYRRHSQVQARQGLFALAEAQGLPPGSWTPSLVQGTAWLRILEQEQEQDCDLIAIGKHGRHAAEELLLGSVTKTVLAEAQADVLVATLPGPDGTGTGEGLTAASPDPPA